MTERSYGIGGYYPEGALINRAENLLYLRNAKSLSEAAARGITLESQCLMCDCNSMTLTIELPDGLYGIMEKKDVCFSPDSDSETKDIAVITRVGKPIQYKILGIDNGCAYLSRRAAQKECYEKYISDLTPGDIIPARITHLEPFGAFCDIGCGIVSLLTVDKISVSRISHPSDRFSIGEYISAVVSSVEDSGRIYLTHRELLGTWEENASLFTPGQTITGIIRSVEDYGVFVELAPNLAGLAESFDGAVPGDCCSVYIKNIIPERMKIKLIIIDTCGHADTPPFRYFIDTEKTWHIDRWQYSPLVSQKNVETVFSLRETESEISQSR